MMMRLQAAALSAALCAAAALAGAQTAQAEPISGLELAEMAGFDAVIDSFGRQVRDQGGMLEAQGVPPEAVQAAAGAFDAEAMMNSAGDSFDDNLSADQRADIAAFLRSPAGARLVELERAAAAPGADEEMMTEGPAALQALGRDPDRAVAYQAIIDATEMRSVFEAVMRSISRSMLDGMLSAQSLQSGGVRPDQGEIDALLEQQLAPALAQMDQLMIVSVATTYRNASQEDLDAYVEFLRSPIGLQYSAVGSATFVAILEDASREFGRRLAETLGSNEL